MKSRLLISVLLMLAAAGSTMALTGEIAFIEGTVDVEKAGSVREAEIGDVLITGDGIFTGDDGTAEIDLGSGSTVTVGTGSVFRMSEAPDDESESGKRSFFRVLLGAVSFKFRGLKNEPDVGTPLSVCSVRGTDFTVYAAADGASMTIVSDGLVEVSSGGEAALLDAGKGIEVRSGLGLGEPFDAKVGFVRYDEFADEAMARLDEDPVAVLAGLTELMRQYAADGKYFRSAYDENYKEQRRISNELKPLKESGDTEAFIKARDEVLMPIARRGFSLDTTYRHHLISGLFLRRYLASGIYLRYRSRYLATPSNPQWVSFIIAYETFLRLYEEELLSQLVEEDL